MSKTAIRHPIPTGATARLSLVVGVMASAAAHADTMPGTLEGTIDETILSLEGTCSWQEKEEIFQFWSDGTQFAVSKDSNGDGMYLNIMVRPFLGKIVATLRYSRNGETIYNGMFGYAAMDERSMSVDTSMGRDKVPAKFQVRCGS